MKAIGRSSILYSQSSILIFRMGARGMMSGPPESSASREPTRIEGPPSDSDRHTEPLLGDSASSGEGTATEVAPPFRPMMIEAKRPSLAGCG